ncbi:hypothetical protein TNCV_2450011 [Trichonephila clavipes]|uniref:Uncharacterized protein n=1 Tax=Trichonephila clavipes TaxID=2585209 RepID=A0A8X6US08_TRICX|nr:hypothetical protein TNCV_2450011 [Trichonephila clavipes]
MLLPGRIIGKLEEGRSVTSVAAGFGIAHSIVSRLWRQFQTTGTAIRGFSSGKLGTTPADDRYIVLHARRNRRQTAGEIAELLRHRRLDDRYRVLPWPEDCTVVLAGTISDPQSHRACSGFLARRLAARTSPPVTIRELPLARQSRWAAMPQQLIDTLILSMGRRCETCLYSQGRSYPLLKTGCFLLDTHHRDVWAFSRIALHATFSIKLLFIPLISLLVSVA